MIPVSPKIMAAVEETYMLEQRCAGVYDPEALRKALESALSSQDRHTRADVAQMAISMAEELDDGDDDDLATDGPAALLWLARAIQQTLPQD